LIFQNLLFVPLSNNKAASIPLRDLVIFVFGSLSIISIFFKAFSFKISSNVLTSILKSGISAAKIKILIQQIFQFSTFRNPVIPVFFMLTTLGSVKFELIMFFMSRRGLYSIVFLTGLQTGIDSLSDSSSSLLICTINGETTHAFIILFGLVVVVVGSLSWLLSRPLGLVLLTTRRCDV
jgi:hypothetical protein